MFPYGGEFPPPRPAGTPRPKDEVKVHAQDFLQQYYTSINLWVWNGPRSIYQYSNMAPRLSGRDCKLLNFLLSLNSEKRLGYKENTTKYRSLSWKPRSHVKILIYRTWPIDDLVFFDNHFFFLARKQVFRAQLLTLFVASIFFPSRLQLWWWRTPKEAERG